MKKYTLEIKSKIEVTGPINVTEVYKRYPGCKILEIDSKKADAICESCESAIAIGDKCFAWNNNVFTCEKCGGSEWRKHKAIILGEVTDCDNI